MNFPQIRMRRLRKNAQIRKLTKNISLSSEDLILPIFLDENLSTDGFQKREVATMPGVFVHNENSALKLCEEAIDKGIPAVILFGIPKKKDESGSSGDTEKAIVPVFSQKIYQEFADKIWIIADLCLCEYTSHGHCGILDPHGDVDNDLTLQRLREYTSIYARSGINMIAPSGMMDGMIDAIRTTLDEEKYFNTSILSYAVKYESAFYGPFRDAAQSSPSFGNRKSYQMPPNRSWEAYREAELDIAEGADVLMVKPGLPYLDIIRELNDNFPLPIFAYQVSGEYAMTKLGGQSNLFNADAVMLESLLAMKRAGASAIISYAALDIAWDLIE